MSTIKITWVLRKRRRSKLDRVRRLERWKVPLASKRNFLTLLLITENGTFKRMTNKILKIYSAKCSK